MERPETTAGLVVSGTQFLKKLFNGSVAENQSAGFEVIALDASGKRIALSNLTYSWVRENTTYQWYQDSGSWKYQSATRDHLAFRPISSTERRRAG